MRKWEITKNCILEIAHSNDGVGRILHVSHAAVSSYFRLSFKYVKTNKGGREEGGGGEFYEVRNK